MHTAFFYLSHMPHNLKYTYPDIELFLDACLLFAQAHTNFAQTVHISSNHIPVTYLIASSITNTETLFLQ